MLDDPPELPTEAQQAQLLEALREGHLLPGAMQLAGIDRDQLEALGSAFADRCQFAYEQGTAALDRQATALGLAGIASPLLAFILRSRARRYSEQPAVNVGLSVGGEQQDGGPSRRIEIEFVPGLDASIRYINPDDPGGGLLSDDEVRARGLLRNGLERQAAMLELPLDCSVPRPDPQPPPALAEQGYVYAYSDQRGRPVFSLKSWRRYPDGRIRMDNHYCYADGTRLSDRRSITGTVLPPTGPPLAVSMAQDAQGNPPSSRTRSISYPPHPPRAFPG